MKLRYELKRPGVRERGNRFTDLGRAHQELTKSVGGFAIWDRLEKRWL